MATLIDRARLDIPTQIPTQLPTAVSRPLYAGVGATDRVVEVVREATDAVTARVDAWGRKDPRARRALVEKRLAELQADAKELPARLQKLVDDQVATAGEAYDELVKRGEVLVGRIRRQPSTTATREAAATTTAKARTTRTQATKTARTAKKSATRSARSTAKKAASSPARSSAKATATSAGKTASRAARATTDAAAKLGD
jgi:DNA-binding protein HU-beta